jgi:hypothetical protein
MKRNVGSAVTLGIIVIAIASTILYWAQGGFGGGHGRFDKTLYVLALPAAALPWPEVLRRRDYMWLIVMPLLVNLSLSALLRAVLARLRASRSRHVSD